MSPSATPSPRARCPVCRKPPADAFAPFCSRGCRDRDLLQWLSDGYRLPGRPVEDEAGENDAAGLDSEPDRPL